MRNSIVQTVELLTVFVNAKVSSVTDGGRETVEDVRPVGSRARQQMPRVRYVPYRS